MEMALTRFTLHSKSKEPFTQSMLQSGMVRTHICVNVVIVFSEFNSCVRSVTDTCGAAGSVNVIIGFNDHCYCGCICLYGYVHIRA